MLVATLLCALLAAPPAADPPQQDNPPLLSGDLVFQTSRSEQSAAIRTATGSDYTHVGIVEVAKDGVFVVEAVQPVTRTPLRRWKARGVGGRWTVLRDPALTEAQRRAVVREAKAQLGKPYDARFGWDDDRLYCSELVHKAFARGAGKRLGSLERLRDLRLQPIRAALAQRYRGAVPLELQVITPASIANDASLVLVATTFPSAQPQPQAR